MAAVVAREDIRIQTKKTLKTQNSWNQIPTSSVTNNEGSKGILFKRVGASILLIGIFVAASIFIVLSTRTIQETDKVKPRTKVIKFDKTQLVCSHNNILHVSHTDDKKKGKVNTVIKNMKTDTTLLSVKYDKKHKLNTTEVYLMGEGPFSHTETPTKEMQALIKQFLESKETQLLPLLSYEIGMLHGITGVHAHHSLPIHQLALSVYKQVLLANKKKKKIRRRLTHVGKAYMPQDAASLCYTSNYEVSGCSWMLDENSQEMAHRCGKCAYDGATPETCNTKCTDGSDHGGHIPHHCPPCGEDEFKNGQCNWYCTIDQMNDNSCEHVANKRQQVQSNDDSYTVVKGYNSLKTLDMTPYSVGRPLLREERKYWTCASARFRNDRDVEDALIGAYGTLQDWYTSGGHCLGMCGPECKCWPWVCGDCGWHSNCFHHDVYWCEQGHTFEGVAGCVYGIDFVMRHWDGPSCFGTILTRNPVETFGKTNEYKQCQWTGDQRHMIWRLEKGESGSVTCKNVPANSKVQVSCKSYKNDNFIVELNGQSIQNDKTNNLANADDYRIVVKNNNWIEVAHMQCEINFER